MDQITAISQIETDPLFVKILRAGSRYISIRCLPSYFAPILLFNVRDIFMYMSKGPCDG